MAKNKDPAVLFYTRDFLADTTLWGYDELGRYIKLLCIQHLQGGIDEADFAEISAGNKRILGKFERGDDGLYRNNRMAKETARRENYKETLRLNGMKGGRPPKTYENQLVFENKPKGFENQNQNESTRVANENVNENKDKALDIDNKKIESEEEEKKKKEEKKSQTDIYIERFERFWQVYPKKVGKGDARRAFVKHQPSEKLTETMIKAVETAKKSIEWTKDGGKYIPNPSTWLNQERWEDELTATPEAVQEQKSEVDKWFEEVYMEGAFRR